MGYHNILIPLRRRDYKKAFGQFTSLHSQRITSVFPVEIKLDSQENIAGGIHSIDFDDGDIIIKQSGMYLIIAAPQVGKIKGIKARWIDFWLKVNNIDLVNSNVRRVLADPQEKDFITLNVVTPLNRGDTINIVMAAETESEGIGIEAIEPEGEPAIPSIIITIVELD